MVSVGSDIIGRNVSHPNITVTALCVFCNGNEVWFGHITLLLNVLLLFVGCVYGRTDVCTLLTVVLNSTMRNETVSNGCCYSFEHGKVSAGVTEQAKNWTGADATRCVTHNSLMACLTFRHRTSSI